MTVGDVWVYMHYFDTGYSRWEKVNYKITQQGLSIAISNQAKVYSWQPFNQLTEKNKQAIIKQVWFGQTLADIRKAGS